MVGQSIIQNFGGVLGFFLLKVGTLGLLLLQCLEVGLFHCSLIRSGLCLLWGERYRILRASVLNLDLQIILTLK